MKAQGEQRDQEDAASESEQGAHETGHGPAHDERPRLWLDHVRILPSR